MKKRALRNTMVLTVSACATALLAGCASMVVTALDVKQELKDRINYYVDEGQPVPLYEHWPQGLDYTYYSEDRNFLRFWYGAYTMADYETDKLIAGERQGDEQSFYLIAAEPGLKAMWKQYLPEGKYGPALLDKFVTPVGVNPQDFRAQYFDTQRARDLDMSYKYMHGVSESYVKDSCRLIVDGNNDSMPGIFSFTDPKYDELYMKRLWPAHVSLMAALTYAKTDAADLKKADRTYMNTDYPFVEELRGTEDEPNVIILHTHKSEQAFHGLGSFTPQYKSFNVAFYRCDADELKEARSEFVAGYKRLLKVTNNMREDSGLQPINPADYTWYKLQSL